MTAEYLSYAATLCFAIGAAVAIAGFRVEALRDTTYQYFTVGLGAVLKTLAIGVTCMASDTHYFNSPSEICALLAWALAWAYLIGLVISGARSLGAVVIPVILIFMGLSLVLNTQGVDPGVHGHTFAAHILTAFLGYALFLTSCAASVLYLEQNRIMKRKTFGVLFRDLPSLERLEKLEVVCAYLGLAVFTLALTSGAAMMREKHLPFWFDPKFVAAQLTWFIFAALVVGRYMRWLHGRAMAKLVLAGAALVLVTFALAHPWAPVPNPVPVPAAPAAGGPA